MDQNEWFSDWFNTTYYHILYKERDDSEAEHFISNLLQVLNPSKEAKFLDLACGKGRHSIFLNSLGYKVWGCDLAEESIKAACEYENERLHFFVQDMREETSQHFDFILNLFTSIGYFDDQEDNFKTFQAISSSLNANGIFVLDFLNEEKVRNEIIPRQTKVINGIHFEISKYLEDGKVVKKIEFEAEGKRHEYYERVDLLSKTDFLNFANKADLKLIAEFGDYDLSPFHSDSDRLILIFQKE